MSETALLIIVLAVIFLVLALVAIFRYDSVQNVLEVLGIKLRIQGKRSRKNGKDKARQEIGSEKEPESSVTPRSTLTVGGGVADSNLQSESAGDASVDIGEGVDRSSLGVQATNVARVHIEEDVRDSDIEVKASGN